MRKSTSDLVKGGLATIALVGGLHAAGGYAFGRLYTQNGYTEQEFDANWRPKPLDVRAHLMYPGVKLAYRLHETKK